MLLVASRDVSGTPFIDGVSKLLVEALTDGAARALLHARNPELSAAIRDRVLYESGGNPLALVELPKAISSDFSEGTLLPA